MEKLKFIFRSLVRVILLKRVNIEDGIGFWEMVSLILYICKCGKVRK